MLTCKDSIDTPVAQMPRSAQRKCIRLSFDVQSTRESLELEYLKSCKYLRCDVNESQAYSSRDDGRGTAQQVIKLGLAQSEDVFFTDLRLKNSVGSLFYTDFFF